MNIKCEDLESTKEILIKKIDKFLIFHEGTVSKYRLSKRLISNINKITTFNRLQKIVADCYNSLGNVIICNLKQIKKNNERTRVYKFYYPQIEN